MNQMTRSNQPFLKYNVDHNTMFQHIHHKFTQLVTQKDPNFKEPYLFCLIALSDVNATNKVVHSCMEHIRGYLCSNSKLCIYEIDDYGQAAFCLQLKSIKDLTVISYDFQIQLTFLSEREGVNFYAGIDSIHSMKDFTTSYEHALNCILLLTEISAVRGVCLYENYTFIKMFALLYQNNRSFVLDNQVLQQLLNYDRSNKTNYVHTIRIYLAENCNVTRSANRLFIHRHTLMNRIQVITNLCGINFEDYYTRVYLSMALLIHDYYAV